MLLTVMAVSLVAVIFKTFIYFDRITLLAVLLVLFHHLLYNQKLGKIVKATFIVLILLMAIFITFLRMSEVSFMEFLGVYFNLGVINLQVLIEKQDQFNYDFTQTFLNPLGYIYKFMGWSYVSSGPKEYIWNNAQSYWGFLYIDFHWMGLFFMPLIGHIIRLLEYYKLSKPFCQGFYFIGMYTLFSFFTIPIVRSIEFWLMIITVLLFTKVIIKYQYKQMPNAGMQIVPKSC